MATYLGDICVVSGKYRDKQTGEDKNNWHQVGKLFKTDRGHRILLNSLPVGAEDGQIWMAVFPPKDKPAPKPKPEVAPAVQPPEDDIPF